MVVGTWRIVPIVYDDHMAYARIAWKNETAVPSLIIGTEGFDITDHCERETVVYWTTDSRSMYHRGIASVPYHEPAVQTSGAGHFFDERSTNLFLNIVAKIDEHTWA